MTFDQRSEDGVTAQSLKDRVAKRLKATGQPKRRRADRYSQPFQSQQKPEGYRFGRPTLYRPEYCQLVIERMGQGFSLTAFAGTIGVSKNAVYEWIRAHADFGDAVSRARPARTLWLEQKLLRSRKGAETTAAIFALRNADPDEWRDVKHQEHQHLHAIRQLTDAELHRIAAGGLADVGDGLTIDADADQFKGR
jgi:hypothetical protein